MRGEISLQLYSRTDLNLCRDHIEILSSVCPFSYIYIYYLVSQANKQSYYAAVRDGNLGDFL